MDGTIINYELKNWVYVDMGPVPSGEEKPMPDVSGSKVVVYGGVAQRYKAMILKRFPEIEESDLGLKAKAPKAGAIVYHVVFKYIEGDVDRERMGDFILDNIPEFWSDDTQLLLSENRKGKR